MTAPVILGAMGSGFISLGLELPLRRLCSQPLTANRYHLSHVPDPVCVVLNPQLGRDTVATLPDSGVGG
jgi:hypothetical protein